MNYYEKLLNIKLLKDKLLDEESKIIFDARIDYMIMREMDTFIEKVWHFLIIYIVQIWNLVLIKRKIKKLLFLVQVMMVL